jgi:hypothetical protein
MKKNKIYTLNIQMKVLANSKKGAKEILKEAVNYAWQIDRAEYNSTILHLDFGIEDGYEQED